MGYYAQQKKTIYGILCPVNKLIYGILCPVKKFSWDTMPKPHMWMNQFMGNYAQKCGILCPITKQFKGYYAQ